MEKREMESFRDYMVKRIDSRKHNLEEFTDLFYSVAEYGKSHSLSVARMILMSGMSRRDFYRAKSGDYDECLAMYLYKEGIEESDAEIVDGLPLHNGVILLPPSEIIDMLYLMMEAKVTEEMLDSKNMPQVTSRIFTKKAVFGYTDQPQPVNNTTVLNISESQLDLADRLLK